MVKTARVAVFLLTIVTAEIFSDLLSSEAVEEAYYKSYELEQSQNYSRAIQVLSPVLSAYPNGYTVNFRIGWLLYLNGNYADALKRYKKALAVYPASIEVMNCISLVHKARNDWARVEEQNYQIIKIDPFNATANYWFAVALRYQKKYDLAEKTCRKMLSAFPTSVWFLQELGENLYSKKRIKECREVFASLRILDPTNETAKMYLELLTEDKEGKQ